VGGIVDFPKGAAVRLRCLQFLSLLILIASAGAAPGLAEGVRSSGVPHSLVGCWGRHVPALPVGTPAGVWLIRISANGAFAAYPPGSTKCDAASDFTSNVSVSAGSLKIGHVPICASKGVYAVKPTGSAFVLRIVSDASCPVRARLLAGTWKRTT
jgi:hypothetical protein